MKSILQLFGIIFGFGGIFLFIMLLKSSADLKMKYRGYHRRIPGFMYLYSLGVTFVGYELYKNAEYLSKSLAGIIIIILAIVFFKFCNR
jgi:hypothetical protein